METETRQRVEEIAYMFGSAENRSDEDAARDAAALRIVLAEIDRLTLEADLSRVVGCCTYCGELHLFEDDKEASEWFNRNNWAFASWINGVVIHRRTGDAT